ncbi:squalene-hopene cyclase [Terriglobus roseus DSM 18391]|uniref:Squalene-hopene cyclase n=1 Tax=Terriglobus roseus (strain DSM 18391 / NRRL B-41598 / KBS 63) TaxID=926566 RepID=I3ZG94_TERRK|nr:squalene-hopene cyclase [Terriglobus roseus DSM 18391]AFL88603.1 squalene-hopene cyclase [Terriglobus roseus DSM 18391]
MQENDLRSGTPAATTASASPAQPRFGRLDLGLDRVRAAVSTAKEWLLGQQHADGYWCGELEADVMLEADYIFLHTLLGTGDPGKMQRAMNEILRHQNDDGGWSLYPGGPSNINYGVKAYHALKLMGWSQDDPILVKAREWVLANGGVVECNTFTKIYLCAFGQYDYDAVPAIPPEIVLAPNWFYFNIYEISSWSRGILVPLSIMYAKKPLKLLPAEQGIDELFVGGRANSDLHLRWDKKIVSWRNFFLFLDRMVHWAERIHIRPLRKVALKKAEEWMLERFEGSDGLGAIYPAMLNAIVALRHLGYSLDDPQMIRAMDEFEKLGIDCPEGTPEYPVPTFRMQPCLSPVWDTAQVVSSLGEAGLSSTDPRMIKAADWLLSKENRHKGDWAQKVKNVEPGGWAFFFNNIHYPDVDDTGEVLLALKMVDHPQEARQHDAAERAINWVFGMQCRNGGWASFDRDNTKMIFQYIPFADHNAMLDPPTVDITGRILETLAAYGYTRRDKRVEAAVQFILREQESDGSWFGRWGVNYLYGTFLVLRGLEAIGFDTNEPQVQQSVEWVRSVQNNDGGWGETCGTYDNPGSRGVGPSTPSQTAWALLALLAGGDTRSDSVAKGVRWLVDHQAEDGSWSELVPGRNGESYYTGTGFPRVFYLGYHLYKQYFPLLALTTYDKCMSRSDA